MNRSTNYNFYLPTNADPMLVSDLVYNFEEIDSSLGAAASKLSSDVLTISAQTLTAAQKAQVAENLGVVQEQDVTVVSGSSTYLTSWKACYTVVNNICTFMFRFVPNTDISNSIGDINTGLPNPRTQEYICMYPVSEVKSSWNLSDVQNRFAGVNNVGNADAHVRACGAYSRGVTYSFGGSYLT